MSLSFNTAPGQVMYAPARDLAYLTPALLYSVARAFNEEYFRELVSVVAAAMHSTRDEAWDELCRANDAYAQYAMSLCEDPAERVEDVLKRSGFTSLHPAAQVGYMAQLGQVVTGMLYQGVRDTTLSDAPRPSSLEDMLKIGHAARRALNGTDEQVEHAELLNGLHYTLKQLLAVGVDRVNIRGVVSEAMKAE